MNTIYNEGIVCVYALPSFRGCKLFFLCEKHLFLYHQNKFHAILVNSTWYWASVTQGIVQSHWSSEGNHGRRHIFCCKFLFIINLLPTNMDNANIAYVRILMFYGCYRFTISIMLICYIIIPTVILLDNLHWNQLCNYCRFDHFVYQRTNSN